MLAYKTNSPNYLDYIASVKTREEILADPKLCVLLENPYVKENMEVALAWRKAKFGDYLDKYNFVEYYLCNGPELDADTLLHYRAEASADPVVMEIAYSYFTDSSVLSEIRDKKYNKPKTGDDWYDCFTNPCFYLGDFSGVMGSMGDSQNVKTFWNNMAARWNDWRKSSDAQDVTTERRQSIGQTGTKITANLDSSVQGASAAANKAVEAVAGSEVLTPNAASATGAEGPISQANLSKMRPEYVDGWWDICKLIISDDQEFADKFKNKYLGSNWHMPKFGDVMAGTFSDAIALTDKAHVARQLGDCYRMWAQVRKLTIFGEGNQTKPITSDKLVEYKQADGNQSQVVAVTHPVPADATKPVKDAVAIKQKIKNNIKKKKKQQPKKPEENNVAENSDIVEIKGWGEVELDFSNSVRSEHTAGVLSTKQEGANPLYGVPRRDGKGGSYLIDISGANQKKMEGGNNSKLREAQNIPTPQIQLPTPGQAIYNGWLQNGLNQ